MQDFCSNGFIGGVGALVFVYFDGVVGIIELEVKVGWIAR
jgi:hypothetical protein